MAGLLGVASALGAQPAASQGEARDEIDETVITAEEPPPHWVDASHQFATNRTQALVQWMDDFFGAPVRDAERADSFLRTIFVDDWDQRDRHDLKLRLRGQLTLPKISRRVDLVFSGEEAEQTLSEDERAAENDVGLRVNVRDSKRSRFDATLSVRSGPSLLPGVRYRYQLPLSERSWARFTQRLQYDTADGVRALTNFDFNRSIDANSVIRWGGRLRYREDRQFWDLNTGLSYRRWFDDHAKYPSAIEYYVALSGRDQPESFATNYRVGILWRKQFFREYLFFEVEPNYNWRRDEFDERREGVLGVVLRLEVMLDDDLVTRARARD